MNVFRNHNVPFAIVVLTGALGWYVATLQETLGNRLSVVYSIDRIRGADSQQEVRIENISRSKIFAGTIFIECREKSGNCVDESVPPRYARVEPFNLAAVTDVQAQKSRIRADVEIPPAAEITIVFNSLSADNRWRFFFEPQTGNTGNLVPKGNASVRFFESGLQSWVIRNFDAALIWSFVVLLGLSLLVILVQAFNLVFGKQEEENAPSKHVVDLTCRRASDRSAGDRAE